ncbi:OB-fold domain-containing protein [Acidiferrimicrobium sp. IK]|uniref:Zn-ribbon domain-containing OB-fold protein n=1 Tax=Acidiferrimicrobium sp. IK TaxID=2871700 RepID=UPI0039670AA5|nr:OB-fold domain-containing protein [Acidiferrimicrobium sp. IK]
MSYAERPPPVTTDYDTAGFWAAASEKKLAVRTCSDCGQSLHMPKAYCHSCGGWETEWKVVPPTATLYTWTTTERELRAGFKPPYTIVCVEVDEAPGVRMVGYLPGRPHLKVGMAMHARFEPTADGTLLPQWYPTP